MPEPVSLSAVFGKPPADAIRYFEQKGYQITWSWRDAWQEAQARAHTVAGITKLEILQDITEGLQEALKQGKTLEQFKGELTPLLKRKGWWGRDAQVNKETGEIHGKGLTPARLSLIYRQNLQTAYMAGRYQQMKAATATHPYWQYIAILDGRTRPAHRTLHGRVFRHDDPIWRAIYPPNGFNCRCRITALNQRALERGQLIVLDSRDWTTIELVDISPRNPAAGKAPVTVFKTPDMPKAFRVDPGFNYNPGQASTEYTGELLLNKATTAQPRLAAFAVQSALANPTVRERVTVGFAQWADQVEQPRGQLRHVGAFTPQTVQRLADHDIRPQSAVISVRDADVIHTHREAKGDRLPWEWYRELPQHLLAPQAVLLEQRPGQPADVLLVFAVEDQAARLVVKIDYQARDRVEGERVDIVTNIVRSGRVVKTGDLKAGRYTLLEGAL